MSLAQKTITGIFWNFSEQLARRGIGIVITLLLAKFLVPEDFGLVAMMGVFLAIATSLMDSGFKQALIRMKGARQIDFNTAFYANLALGLISYALLFLSAPFIADFYNEARLIALIRVASLNIIINSFQVVQRASLSRDLNFKAQLKARVPAGFLSGVLAIIMAYTGFGVWSLVFQMIFGATIATILLWHLQGWRPSISFSRQSFIQMYNFGYKLFLSGLLDTIFRNIYVVVIGKIFSATIAGQFFFANKIKELVLEQLFKSIQNVTYPALSKLQDNNIRLKSGYRKVLQLATFVLFPSMAILAALAEPMFQVLLPEKWLPSVPMLQIMCISGLLYPLHSINLNILKVKGRSDIFLYLEIYKKFVIIIILFISVRFGVYGILVGQAIASVLAYIPNSYFASRLIDYSVREQISDFMPGLVLSSSVALAAYVAGILLQWPPFLKLIVLVIVGASLYIAVAHIFRMQAYVLARKMFSEKLAGRS